VSQPEPAAGNNATGSNVESPAEPVVTCYVVVGVRTSAGPGPGVKRLPASEVGLLVGMKYAVYGDRAPNEPYPEPTARRFGGPIPPARPAHSN
jgi:hypothetical protein